MSPATRTPPNRQLLSTPHVLQAELGKAWQQIVDAQAEHDRLRGALAAEQVRCTAGVVLCYWAVDDARVCPLPGSWVLHRVI